MWQARTKTDLIIEVWEKLDCEDVGAAEIEAIGTVVADRFGDSAVDSPMVLARLLADEGAYLRHSEIMKLYLDRVSDRPYDAAFRDILRIQSLRTTLATIGDIENLRRQYLRTGDKTGLRLCRETGVRGRAQALEIAADKGTDDVGKAMNAEIAHWFSVWLQTPEFFQKWVELRQRSKQFVETFGQVQDDA